MKGRAGLLVAALALVGVLILAIFPAGAYLGQRHERRVLAAQVRRLGAENQALQDLTAKLGSDAEIERLARGYNLVKPGEEVYFIPPQAGPPATTPPPAATTPSPAGAVHRPTSLWRRITSIF